jgi:ferritin
MRVLDAQGNPEQKETKQGVQTVDAMPTMRYTEKIIDESRRKCTLSSVMVEMLVKQMSAELANHSLYRTFANYFDVEGLPKLATYWLGRAAEEYLHHEWIYKYLTTNDALFQYPPVPAIKVNIIDRVMPFAATVDREIETTMGINRIVDQAQKEGDWATFQWLNGEDEDEGRLVKEQVEEESISRTILDMAKEEGSWLRKQSTILAFYRNPDSLQPSRKA